MDAPRVHVSEATWEKIAEIYHENQLVIIESGAFSHGDNDSKWPGYTALQSLYTHDLPKFKDTWTVEKSISKQHTPYEILGPQQRPSTDWYVSFILQHNPELVQTWLDNAPISHPSFLGENVSHSNCIWVFCGQNTNSVPMKGRGEHIDQVYHSGTWHGIP